MTTLQHTLNLLEMVTEVFYRNMYYTNYLPQSEIEKKYSNIENTKLIYEAKWKRY